MSRSPSANAASAPPPPWPSGSTPPVAPRADALSVDRESAERVRAALFTLSDAQRDLLEAAWFEGVEPGSAALTASLTEALDALAEAIGAQP